MSKARSQCYDFEPRPITRRRMLERSSIGFGGLALAGLLGETGLAGERDAKAASSGPLVEQVTINGIVLRSSGNNYSWINGDNIRSGDATPEGIRVETRQLSGGGTIRLVLPSGLDTVQLKPGQKIDVMTGSVLEPYEQRPAERAVKLFEDDLEPERYSSAPSSTDEVLSELLGLDVILADDCVGDGVKALVGQLEPGQVMLLENLRFHAGETKNDPEFVRRLSAPFDPEKDGYLNDAFGACHRAHASVTGVTERFSLRAAGFLLEKEIGALVKLLQQPARPFVAIVGGSNGSRPSY